MARVKSFTSQPQESPPALVYAESNQSDYNAHDRRERYAHRIIWGAGLAGGCMVAVMIFGDQYYRCMARPIYGFLWGAPFVAGLAIIVVNSFLLVTVKPQRRDIREYAASEHSGGAKRIRIQTTSGRLTKIGRVELYPDDWGRLGVALENADWHWSRRIIAGANVFTSLTNNFSEITKDMINMGIVNDAGSRVTPQGREWFDDFLPTR